MATQAATAGTKRVLRIVSKCGTEEEFLTVFGRFCDEKSLFVVTSTPREVGSSSRFSITLSDGKPMLVGAGEVVESYANASNPYGRPGMRMEFTELDAESKTLVRKLAEAGRQARAAVTPRANAPGASAMKKTIMFGVPAGGKPLPPPTMKTPASPPKTPETKAPPAAPVVPPAAATQRAPVVPVPVVPLPKVPGATPTPPMAPVVSLRDRKETPPPKPSPLREILNTPATPMPVVVPDPVPEPIPEPVPEPVTEVGASIPDHVAEELSIPTAVHDRPGGMLARAPSSPIPDENEQRTPGSDFILPANPFGALTDDALEAFVECTLYEETGQISLDEVERREAERRDLERRIDETPLPVPTPMGRAESPTPAPAPPASAPATQPYGQASGAPATTPWGSGAAIPVPPPLDHGGRMPTEGFLRPRRMPGIGVLIGIAVASAVLSLVIGYLIWGGGGDDSGDDPPATKAAVVDEPTPPAKPDRQPVGAPDPQPDEQPAPEPDKQPDKQPGKQPDKQPEPEPEPDESVAAGDCAVSVATASPGARVYADGKDLGLTPLKADVPCATKALVLRHPRYESMTRTVKLAPGSVTKVSVSMNRPAATLTVSSSPAGAAVTVNGRSAGNTPLTTQIRGFERVSVKVSKSGYQSASKTVVATGKTAAARFTLKRGGGLTKPPPKPAPKPTTRRPSEGLLP